MGRHRSGTPDPSSGRYDGAGKRRKVRADEPVLTISGRHRAPQRRSSLVRVPLAAPRIAGAAALAAAVAGSLAVSGSSGAGTAYEAATSVSPRRATAEELERRDLSVSRSASRSSVSGSGLRAAQVDRLARERLRALEQLTRQAALRARELQRQWVLPMSSYRLTGTFGERSYLWSTVHTGLDFAAPTGTAIRAVAGGQVTEAGWAGSYGYRTIVTLPDGTEIWYCHQSRIDVSSGDEVERDQTIGAVGSTGNVTGPHLHLEVRPDGGDPVDPDAALAAHGVAP